MVGRVPQRQLIAADSGGTVHTVQTDDQGRLLSNIVGGEVVARLGTLSVVKGGTIDVAETVQIVDELRSGTIDQVKLLQSGNVSSTIAADGVGLLKTADQPLDVSSASVPVIQPLDITQDSGLTVGATVAVDNVGLFKSGQDIGSVSGTVETPRSASFGTIASGFPVDGANQVPGTADVRTLDGFSLGMDADGTIEVSHQIQTVPGGNWREDGLGTLVTNEERISTINHKGLRYRPSLSNLDASSTVSVNVDWMGN